VGQKQTGQRRRRKIKKKKTGVVCACLIESHANERERRKKSFSTLSPKSVSLFFFFNFIFFFSLQNLMAAAKTERQFTRCKGERENPLFIQSVELDRRLAGIDVMRKRGCPKRKKRRRGLLRHWLLLLRQGGRCITKTKKKS
jgi:hypothetical protein